MSRLGDNDIYSYMTYLIQCFNQRNIIQSKETIKKIKELESTNRTLIIKFETVPFNAYNALNVFEYSINETEIKINIDYRVIQTIIKNAMNVSDDTFLNYLIGIDVTALKYILIISCEEVHIYYFIFSILYLDGKIFEFYNEHSIMYNLYTMLLNVCRNGRIDFLPEIHTVLEHYQVSNEFPNMYDQALDCAACCTHTDNGLACVKFLLNNTNCNLMRIRLYDSFKFKYACFPQKMFIILERGSSIDGLLDEEIEYLTKCGLKNYYETADMIYSRSLKEKFIATEKILSELFIEDIYRLVSGY